MNLIQKNRLLFLRGSLLMVLKLLTNFGHNAFFLGYTLGSYNVKLLFMALIIFYLTYIFSPDPSLFWLRLVLLFVGIFFTTSNLWVFFITFEVTIVTVRYLLLNFGNYPEKIPAFLYMILYSRAGGLPLLLGIILSSKLNGRPRLYLYTHSHLALLVLPAFLIKLPIFGLHGWLPLVHVQAPVWARIILAAVLLKMGGYGLLILINRTFKETYWIRLAGVLGSIFALSHCLFENDAKKIVAFRRIGHIGLVIISAFWNNEQTVNGSINIIVAHGFVSSAMFYLLNILTVQVGSRRLSQLKGLYVPLPIFRLVALGLLCCNSSLPPSLNFFGEVISIIGLTTLFPTIFPLIFCLILLRGLFNAFLLARITKNNPSLLQLTDLKRRDLTLLVCHLIPVSTFWVWFFKIAKIFYTNLKGSTPVFFMFLTLIWNKVSS